MDNIILKLEKSLDKKLNFSTSLKPYKKTYTKNKENNIVGLSLYNVQLENLDKLLPLSSTLEELLLINCNIVDLSLIKNFQNLKKLELRDNPIPHDKIKSILKLKKLTNLELSGTKITDTSILSSLSKLEYLDISSSFYLTQVDGLEKLPRLKYLDCSGSEFQNFHSISDHEFLTHLKVNCSALESMSGIEGFPNLTHLDLSSTSIKQLEGLEKLKHLKHLDVSSSHLNKISNLNGLENLRTLDLSSTNLTKIEGLDSLVNLKVLELGRCQITKIEGLESLTNLERLQLRENEISKVENLENLVNLEYLNVEMNKIREIDPQFLLNIHRPCKIYLGSDTLKEKELDIKVPEHIEIFF